MGCVLPACDLAHKKRFKLIWSRVDREYGEATSEYDFGAVEYGREKEELKSEATRM